MTGRCQSLVKDIISDFFIIPKVNSMWAMKLKLYNQAVFIAGGSVMPFRLRPTKNCSGNGDAFYSKWSLIKY